MTNENATYESTMAVITNTDDNNDVDGDDGKILGRQSVHGNEGKVDKIDSDDDERQQRSTINDDA